MVYFGKKQSGGGVGPLPANTATTDGNNTFTGNNTFNNPVGVGTPVNNNDATTKQYVDDALANKADTSTLANYAGLAADNTFTGNNTFNNAIVAGSSVGIKRAGAELTAVEITNQQTKTIHFDFIQPTAGFRNYCAIDFRIKQANGTYENGLKIEARDNANGLAYTTDCNFYLYDNKEIRGLANPTTDNSAATKQYVDNLVNQRLPETIPVNTEFATGQTLDGKRVYCYYINNSNTNIVDNSTTNIAGISGVKHLISYSLSYSNNGQFDERYTLPYFDFNSSGALQSKLNLIVGNDGTLKLVAKNVLGNKFLQGLFIYTKD